MSRQASHDWLTGHGFGTKRQLNHTVSHTRRLRFEPLEGRHLLATITVTSLLDNGAGGTTLREATAAANNGDTIVFAASLFSGGPATIQLQDQGSGNPDFIRIQDSITIQGSGADLLTIRAYDPTPTQDNGDGGRIFNVGDGTSSFISVMVSGLTLAGGDPALDDVDLGSGGAIRNMENLTIVNCVFTDNYTTNGGAISNAVGSGGGGAGTLTITDSTFSGNRADDGGAVLLESGTAVITRAHFEDNFATNVGGAINSRNAPLTITDSMITGNDAGNPETEFSGAGGGIAMYGSTLSITGTTISLNTAGYKGGGIYNYDSNVTITNSTISGNFADLNGGGFYQHYLSNGTVEIRHSTITGNTVQAAGSGGGIYNATGASALSIIHTIVAGNLRGAGTRDDMDGSINVQFSLVGDDTGATINNQGGNLIGTMAAPIDPMLGPLANNGGLTLTHSPLLGSKAINAGNSAAVAGSGGVPLFDQRGAGFDRVLGSQIDIGAVEIAAPITPEPELPGDYNRDGSVDAADYVMWVKTFGLAVPQYEGADGDGDTSIGNGDYTVWTENFGETLPGSGGGSLEVSSEQSEIAAESNGTSQFALAMDDVTDVKPATPKSRSLPASQSSESNDGGDLLNVLSSVFGSADDSFVESDADRLSDTESDARDEALDEPLAGIGEAL